MSDQRPVNLDLTTIHFPIHALVSITHRATGVVLFIGAPVVIWCFALSLESAVGFGQVRAYLSYPFGVIFAMGYALALSFHLAAGIKHLFMDCGIGDTSAGARNWSIATIIATFVFFLILLSVIL